MPKKRISDIVKYLVFAGLVFALFSCTHKNRKLEYALEAAGENREELQKFIDHYQSDPADSLKYRAAKFLVENMPNHFSYDTTYLKYYRPVVNKIQELRETQTSNDEIKAIVNPMLDSILNLYPLYHVYSKTESDLTVLKSDFLIANTNLAFQEYTNNHFFDSISFQDFLEYVLPYRINNGDANEDWRSYFFNKYNEFSKSSFTNVMEYADSLLVNFKDTRLGWKIADKYPYLKFEDYLKSQVTHCPQKCWLNCMLLRSHGIPISIDFVPASRVHTVGHEWNTIKVNNKLYAIEPFWCGHQVEKQMFLCYGKLKNHPIIGPIQFPKIYRKTFKSNITNLLEYSVSNNIEIPPLFRNPFMLDVTNEYFNTYDFDCSLDIKDKSSKYGYACIIGPKNNWVPADYAQIRYGKMKYKSLGSKNVYLPAYYKYNSYVPAAYPFLIKTDGKIICLDPDLSNKRNIAIKYVGYLKPNLPQYFKNFIGCTVEGANDEVFLNSDTLYFFEKEHKSGVYKYNLEARRKYRYVRFKINNLNLKLNDLRFFKNVNGYENEIFGRLISSHDQDSVLFGNLFDDDYKTSLIFNKISKDSDSEESVWVGFDFQSPVKLSSFQFYFALSINVRVNGIYELFYWDFGWKSLGVKQVGDDGNLQFENVPDNALLIIKVVDSENGAYSRPFTYSDGQQYWW